MLLFTEGGDLGIECDHEEWFPVVGLDSANAIHVNYGQEPFRYDAIVGACCCGTWDAVVIKRPLTPCRHSLFLGVSLEKTSSLTNAGG